MLYKLNDLEVELKGENHFIAHNAVVVGNVVLENNVSIWFGVTIRAETDPIIVGEDSNIQDGAVLHTDPGYTLRVGKGVTVGHKAMLHGCEIGDNSLIGINAVILNGAKIGKNCIIGAGALVPEKMEIPDNSLVVGNPAKVKKQVSDEVAEMLKTAAHHYVENGKNFRDNMKQDDRHS